MPKTSSLLRQFRLGWISILILVALGIAFQASDLFNDRAVANIISTVCIATAALVLLSIIYRWMAIKSSIVSSGLVVTSIVLLPAVLLKFRGFSGDMMPLLEYRFASVPKLQESIIGPLVQTDATEVATTSFPQFLGPQRNAVIENREFAIPDGDELELWRIAIGEGWAGFAIQGQCCVTLEQRDQRECVTCYRLADGALLWMQTDTVRHKHTMGGAGPRSTPTIVGDLVYTQGATGIVQCLKLATGEQVWKQNLLELAGWSQNESEASITWGRAASPLVVNSFCVIPFGRPLETAASSDLLAGRSLIALDAASGEVKWTTGEDQISYASPVLMTLAGLPQIVSVNETTVTGHFIEDGALLWSFDWPGASNGGANCSSALAIGDDSILIAKGYSTGCAVFTVERDGNHWSVQEEWRNNRVLKTKFTHACINGEVAFGLSDGTLECVSLQDGKRLWMQGRTGRYAQGQVIRVGDCLIVQAESGQVAFVAASPKEFRELATINALSSKTWTVPTIAGRYLAVRNDVEAVLYRLPAK